MCYYNGIKLTQIQFIKLKNFEKEIAGLPFIQKDLLNGFDYGTAPVLKKREQEKDFDIVEMEWGFLPVYLQNKDDVMRFRNGYKKQDGSFQQPLLTLNATCEDMLNKGKIFREAALSRRCLVLSSGFYEWRHVHPLSKRTGKPLKTPVKFPYHIGLKDRDYFFMAGIWQPWQDRETGEYIETFSVITTAANSLMETIHNSRKRMPVILPEDLAATWLLETISEEEIQKIACYQLPAEYMEACTVAKDFRNNPDPSMPFEYTELPGLELDGESTQGTLF